MVLLLAERVGFEPTVRHNRTPDFECVAHCGRVQYSPEESLRAGSAKTTEMRPVGQIPPHMPRPPRFAPPITPTLYPGANTAPSYAPETHTCFVCRHFGVDFGAAIRCDHPKWGRLHGTPKTGCCDWEREPGAEG